MEITLKNVQKTYPRSSTPALKVDHLSFQQGQVHGILGHSGSGKSTMLNLLALLDQPDASDDEPPVTYTTGDGNSISFTKKAGVDSKGTQWTSEKWRLSYLSFVFQSGYLLENFTVLDNVLMPVKLKRKVVACDVDQAKAKLLELGLGEKYWSVLPRHLSGGEYQRVSVVRAIVHEPEVVFADEPTGNLDPGWGVTAMNCLRQWREFSADNLLVLVTHNMEHAMTYCDRISVIRGGKVVLDEDKTKLSEDILRKHMNK